MAAENRAALILTGGGARAAYQVGVLQAVTDILPDKKENPFPIICGTSAGAINAASLACHAEDFGVAVKAMVAVWRGFHVDQVYRSDLMGLATGGLRWLSSFAWSRLAPQGPRSLLDNSPLATLLTNHLDFDGIGRAINAGKLHALSISASGYTSGHSVSFFQAKKGVMGWQRAQRKGARTRIGVKHLLASSAIPFVFPAVELNREFFGDGSMRQIAPISPAIHLGAEKVLVVGSGRVLEQEERTQPASYPSFAQVAGHAMAAIFLDTLSVDIESMARINSTLGRLTPEARERAGITLRPIRSLVITPTEQVEDIAADHASSLPRNVRFMLGGIGAMNKRGGALLSYLLFEQPYTRALVDLGYSDTMNRKEEVRAFFEL